MEEANIRLLEKSETDALTRLANRFRLNDYLDQVFEKALSEQTPLAMEILDIDYLSSIMITTDIRQGMSALSGSQSSLS